jgi:hypothetical protein
MNCVFWFINVLFSDDISPKFDQLEGRKNKNLLDSGLMHDEFFV